MQAVVTLLDDHHYVAGMLGVLDACARQLEAGRTGRPIDPDMLAGVGRYFDQFVPAHERKEEECLFARLERDMPAHDRHVLAALRGEHRVLDALRAAWLPLLAGAATPELSSLARAYIVRKREHMRMEDALLHRALHLPDDQMGEAFAELERGALGPTGREWYTQVALDYIDIVSTWGAANRSSVPSARRRAEPKMKAERARKRER